MSKFVVLTLFLLIATFACSDNPSTSDVGNVVALPTSLSSVYASSSTFPEEGTVRGVANLESLHVDGLPGGIRVSGTGTVSVEPDVAILQVGVEVFAGKVSTARSEASKAMDSVISVLKKEGVEEKDIQTTRFNIYPRYDYEEVTINGKGLGRKFLLATL